MPSREIEDFDPIEWKELAPGMYCHRQDRTMIAFRCPKKTNVEEQKTNVEEQKTS